MIYLLLSFLNALSVATLLFAASFKVRFGLTDNLTLFAPAIAIISTAVIANILLPKFAAIRLTYAFAFLALLAISIYTFVYGGMAENQMLYRIIINCAIGFFVVLFPWQIQSLKLLLCIIVIFGCLLTANTYLTYDEIEAATIFEAGVRSGYDEEIREGYLSVTFAMALACLAALYFLVEKFSPISIAVFVICWLGIAVSLGRGSLLFCALVSILYLITLIFTRIDSFGKIKKLCLLSFFIAMIPIVFIQAMSIERTAERMLVLFTDTDAGAGVQGRFNKYNEAMEQIVSSPLLGNGLGAYRGGHVETLNHPHNIFLQYAVDGGLVGLIVLLLFFAIVLIALRRAIKLSKTDTINTVLVSGALFTFMLLSYIKSHDAYRGREVFVLSALPIATYLTVLANYSTRRVQVRKKRHRRRKRIGIGKMQRRIR